MTIIIYSILLYFLSRTIVWYWTYYSINRIASREAAIQKRSKSFVTFVIIMAIEITLMVVLSPIIGLLLTNFNNADTAMRSSIQKTATSISDPEASSIYLRVAMSLWDKEVEKELGKA